MPVTKDEFIEMCRQSSKKATEELLGGGLSGVPCDCGEEICKGWRWDFLSSSDLAKAPQFLKDFVDRQKEGATDDQS